LTAFILRSQKALTVIGSRLAARGHQAKSDLLRLALSSMIPSGLDDAEEKIR